MLLNTKVCNSLLKPFQIKNIYIRLNQYTFNFIRYFQKQVYSSTVQFCIQFQNIAHNPHVNLASSHRCLYVQVSYDLEDSNRQLSKAQCFRCFRSVLTKDARIICHYSFICQYNSRTLTYDKLLDPQLASCNKQMYSLPDNTIVFGVVNVLLCQQLNTTDHQQLLINKQRQTCITLVCKNV